MYHKQRNQKFRSINVAQRFKAYTMFLHSMYNTCSAIILRRDEIRQKGVYAVYDLQGKLLMDYSSYCKISQEIDYSIAEHLIKGFKYEIPDAGYIAANVTKRTFKREHIKINQGKTYQAKKSGEEYKVFWTDDYYAHIKWTRKSTPLTRYMRLKTSVKFKSMFSNAISSNKYLISAYGN